MNGKVSCALRHAQAGALNIRDVGILRRRMDAESRQFDLRPKPTVERKRAEAQGDADAIKLRASAISANGGAEYVQLQAISKWDGHLPTTNAGGSLPFINLK